MAKFRISISEILSGGTTSYSPVDVDSFEDFVAFIKSENVKTFNLKYRSVMDDIPDFQEMGLSITDLKQEHFNWLVEKNKWQSKSVEIVNRLKQKNTMDTRKENFKIGTFHGILKPEQGSKEAKLRNALYLIGNLYLPITNSEGIKIRIIGYEIPIENRGKRIDLIGYDTEKNPWIIELKADSSNEKISVIIEQVNGYSSILPSLLPGIKEEFLDKFFLELKLTDNIQKMILAPREFFEQQEKNSYPKMQEIYLCSIARVKEIFDSEGNLTLDTKLNQFDELTMKIENR